MTADLITRLEAAQPSDARELFEEVAKSIWCWDCIPIDMHPDDWVKQWNLFHRRIDAAAYLDAAAMFVPEGWLVAHLSELGGAGGCCCTLGNPGTGQDVTADAGERTMAFALLSAAMKARQTDER